MSDISISQRFPFVNTTVTLGTYAILNVGSNKANQLKYMEDNKGQYSTRQLGEASALVTLGFPVTTIDHEYERNTVIGYFSFDNTPELQEAVHDFLNRKVLVEPNEYQSNLRSLKSRVSNQERASSLRG